jgi:hypothetical protein
MLKTSDDAHPSTHSFFASASGFDILFNGYYYTFNKERRSSLYDGAQTEVAVVMTELLHRMQSLGPLCKKYIREQDDGPILGSRGIPLKAPLTIY